MNSAQQHGAVDEAAAGRAERAQRNIERDSGSFGDGLAIAISGFPGCGKTTAAEVIRDKFSGVTSDEVVVVDMKAFAENNDVDKHDARTFIGAIDKELGLTENRSVVFDGVKSLSEFEYISKFFDSLGIIYIYANHAARHARLIEQAKNNDDDLDDYSHDSLRELDLAAGAAGLNVIEETMFYDVELTNVEIDETMFRHYARVAAQDILVDFNNGKL